MSAPVWQPGHLYAPGALVVPTHQLVGTNVPVTNGTFEAGNTGWTLATGWDINATGTPFAGSYCAVFSGVAGNYQAASNDREPVVPGQSITASVMIDTTTNGVNNAGGTVRIGWYDSLGNYISAAEGNDVRGGGNGYFMSQVTGIAPSNAATAGLILNAYVNSAGAPVYFDNAQWNYSPQSLPSGLVYEAVQSAIGTSASTEPLWPTAVGTQITDNTVIWQAVQTSRVVWEAIPLLVSGTVEPAWPNEPGGTVLDNTIMWVGSAQTIKDSNCPQSTVVAINSAKVFAADKDIVRFSATANPLDWSSANDAGFLPTGLTQSNSNNIAVMNLYRGNLVVMNANQFQMWQTDPDPTQMALLDALEGIGSTRQRAAQPVGNDMMFLAALGVRAVGMAAGTGNLAAAGAGLPVDKLMTQDVLSGSGTPVAAYYPSLGQYWLAWNTEAYVYTMNMPGAPGVWSKYQFAVNVNAMALAGDTLYSLDETTGKVYAFDPTQGWDYT